MFVWRLCLLVLVATLLEAVHVQQPQRSHEIKVTLPGKTTDDPDVITDRKLWTPEVTIHLLSLVETLHTKLASFEGQMSTAQKGLEQKVDNLQVQLVSKINDAESMIAAVEQRLQSQIQAAEVRFSGAVSSTADKLSGLEDRLELKIAHLEEVFRNNLDNVEQRLKNEILAGETRTSGGVSAVAGKVAGLEPKITNLGDLIRDNRNENCPPRSDVSVLSLTYELSQFGKSFIEEVEDRLGKVTNKIDVDRSEIMDYFRNVTNKLEEGINKEIDSLVNTGLEQIQNLNRSNVEFVGSYKNVTRMLEKGISRETESLAQTGLELYKNGSEILGKIQKALMNERRESLEEIKSMTDDLTKKIENATNPLVLVNRNITSSVAKHEGLFERFSEEIQDKITNLNTQLLQEFDEKLETLNASFYVNLENQSITLDKLGSTIDNLYTISKRNEPTLESCKKGMMPRPAPQGLPYYLVYSGEKQYLCDTETNFGGWIIIQYRSKGDTSFDREWEDYKHGFGTLHTDFWVGLETIHQLTSSATYELRVDLKYNGGSKFAHYSTFSVASESDNYRLSLGSYDGTAGDSLSSHNGSQFTTKDKDNDRHSTNCATQFSGGWWYYSGCHQANLNGNWGDRRHGKGVNWNRMTSYINSVSFSAMKVRRVE